MADDSSGDDVSSDDEAMGLGSRRRRRRPFGDDDDDEEKPMAFVSASSEPSVVEPSVVEQPPEPAPIDHPSQSKPEWERHTKGIGSRLLAKMGFTGRLGKDATGTAEPVQVSKRPDGLGLGFGGEEKPQKPTKRAKERKNRYIQPTTRVLATVLKDEAIFRSDAPVDVVRTNAERLLEALEAAVNGEEAALRDAEERIQAEVERGLAFRRERDHAVQDADRFAQRATLLREAEALATKCRSSFDSRDHRQAAKDVKRTAKDLREKYPKEVALGNLCSYDFFDIPSFLSRVFDNNNDDDDDDDVGALVADVVDTWRNVFSSTEDDDDDDFRTMCATVLEPRDDVRMALSKPNLFEDDDDANLRLCETLRVVGVHSSMLATVVAPRLAKRLKEAGDARFVRRAAVWVARVFPGDETLVTAGVETLKRLTKQALRQDLAGLEGVAKAVTAWRSLLDDRRWKRFLAGLPTILASADDPRYLRALGTGLGVPDPSVAALIEGELAPRFNDAIRSVLVDQRWLDAGLFYLDWRSALFDNPKLPQLGPLSTAAAKASLHRALDLIDVALTLDTGSFAAFQPRFAESTSYDAAMKKRRLAGHGGDDDKHETSTPRHRKVPRSSSSSPWQAALNAQGGVVFHDVVARFAEDNDLVFLPKHGRLHDGKQLFAFGSATIFLDRNVTFVLDPQSRTWTPMPLEDLLLLARSSKA